MSSFLISQLLRYGVLTVSSFLRHSFDLPATGIDLSKWYLQVPNLAPRVREKIKADFLLKRL
jgi:hypothetical protein